MKKHNIALIDDDKFGKAYLYFSSIWLSINFIKFLFFIGVVLLVIWVALTLLTGLFVVKSDYGWHAVAVLFITIWGVHLLYLRHCSLVNHQKAHLGKIISRIMDLKEMDSETIDLEPVFEKIDRIIDSFSVMDRHYVFGEFLFIYRCVRSKNSEGGIEWH